MNTQNQQGQTILITAADAQVDVCAGDPDARKLLPGPIRVSAEEAQKPGVLPALKRQLHFVRRRAEGASYAAIAAEIGIAPSTLVKWSRKYRQEIQNLRAIRMESLLYEGLSDPEKRVRSLSKLLTDVEAELGKRNVAELSTSRLFSLADTLRRRISAETGAVKFAVSADEDTTRDSIWQG